MLVKVADKDVAALIKSVQKLPRELYKSLTWDRGKELANLPRLICPRYARPRRFIPLPCVATGESGCRLDGGRATGGRGDRVTG
jgi:hypothetical protein